MFIEKPPMGWNSWNTFGSQIDEKLVLDSARSLVENGLSAVGYDYVVIDDCWSLKQRDKNGKLVPDPAKFPSGMRSLADKIHAMGLKFGMYSCCGLMTCAGYPSALDREWTDAHTFAEWGVDYLKYDYCYKPENRKGETLYRAMGTALACSGRDIVFSACNWGTDESPQWICSTGADLWRSTGDIIDNFNSVRDSIRARLTVLPYGGKGCFNDMDMLVVGMNGKGNVGLGGCSQTEYRTHFAAWCMFQSPLMIGCDVRSADAFTLDLLKNRLLISIDQDEKCAQCTVRVFGNEGNDLCFTAARPLADGDLAIGFFNLSENGRELYFLLEEYGIGVSSGRALELCDCWEGKKSRSSNGAVSVRLAPHDCVVYRAKIVEG